MGAANERITLIGLIETVRGIENCAAIMATPGLDVGWLGHYDLTNDLGITGQFDHPQFVSAAEQLAGACTVAGKTAASLDGNLEFLRAQAARGYRLLGYGQDIAVMRSGSSAGLAALRAVGGGGSPTSSPRRARRRSRSARSARRPAAARPGRRRRESRWSPGCRP
jgi:2-keto-3-deoxy-L-rhamnonate aldolase RhmA